MRFGREGFGRRGELTVGYIFRYSAARRSAAGKAWCVEVWLGAGEFGCGRAGFGRYGVAWCGGMRLGQHGQVRQAWSGAVGSSTAERGVAGTVLFGGIGRGSARLGKVR